MSGYLNDPDHDLRSAYSQRIGTGQILGAPGIPDMPRATVSGREIVQPHWAAGCAPCRTER